MKTLLFCTYLMLLILAKCCLHTDSGDCREKIVPFTEHTLNLCKDKQQLRLQRVKQSKYNAIVLPPSADGYVGYHQQCYRRFISIKPLQNISDPNPNLTGNN